MNKIILLVAIFITLSWLSLVPSEAFCGGCGCNVFNCNCDWRPDQCKRKRDNLNGTSDGKVDFESGKMGAALLFKAIDTNSD